MFTAPATPLRQEDRQEPVKVEPPKRVVAQSEPDWEKRRFELVEKLVLQGRLSVILGKTQATDEQIAAKSRHMADAAIKELQTHPYKSDDDEGRTENAE